MSQSPPSFVILHGAFARPSGTELMEVAALHAANATGDGYRTLVRCDVPDTPASQADEGGQSGISEEENRKAPAPDKVFRHVHRAFALSQATVVMWGGMAFRFHAYAESKGLENPCAQTRVVDLQAAAVLFWDLRTNNCKDPRNVLRALDLNPPPDCLSRGSLPYARAMRAVLQRLLADGWTPEATPGAVLNGADIGLDAEEMRIERWEQIRERQNNLGIQRRPLPDETPAFIILDGEFVAVRSERISRLIEVALVVAYRKDRPGRVGYELGSKSFTSLVQLQQVEDTQWHAWKITGIDREAVRRAPPLPRVMAGMVAAAPWDRGVLITWGPDDASIITQNCVLAGIPSPITEIPLIDLQRAFSRFYDLSQPQVGLQNAAAFLEIDTSTLDLHRALADTELTWRVLERMLADGWTPHWRTWHRRQAQGM